MMRRGQRQDGASCITATSTKHDHKQLFSSLNLQDAAKWSATVVDDEIIYPALAGGSHGQIDSLWMAGFLDHSQKTHDEQADEKLQSFLGLPGDSTLPPAASDYIRRKTSTNGRRPKTLTNSNFSRKSHNRNEVKLKASQRKQQRQHPNGPKSRKANPYESTNHRISTVLKRKAKPVKRNGDVTMRSELLENLFLINREEAEAAIVIQSLFRRYRSIIRMKDIMTQNRSAKAMQALVRGHIARVFVAKLRRRLVWAANRCQRHFRCRKAWRRWRQNQRSERRAARKIQSIARMWLAGRLFSKRFLDDACTKIQTSWRGFLARQLRVRLWLDKNATTIQCWRRIEIARRSVYYVRRGMITSALLIQAAWRGHASRMQRDQVLYEQQLERRANQVRIYTTEEQYWSERLEILQKKMESDEDIQKWRSMLSELPKKECDLQDAIQREEALLSEQSELRQHLSPRSVEQGWQEQVERNISHARASITALKLELMFEVRGKMRQAEIDLKERSDEIKEAQNARDLGRKLREEELEKLWAYQRQHEAERLRKSRLQDAADERRRWEVSFTVPSGKPEKEEGNLANERKRKIAETPKSFCGGTADLTAGSRPSTGSSSSLSSTLTNILETIKLRSYQNETMQFDRLITPMLDKMKKAQMEVIDNSALMLSSSSEAPTDAGAGDDTAMRSERSKDQSHSIEVSKSNSRKPLPRTMPFDLLNQVRKEREAFEREAESIRSDVHCRRWLEDAAV